MSDILIKGMEMPTSKNGALIFAIRSDGMVEDVMGCYIRKAAPVPAHGRLIDADALYEDCALDHNYEVAATTTRINEYMQLKIDAAPTIIPASEEDKT